MAMTGVPKLWFLISISTAAKVIQILHLFVNNLILQLQSVPMTNDSGAIENVKYPFDLRCLQVE